MVVIHYPRLVLILGLWSLTGWATPVAKYNTSTQFSGATAVGDRVYYLPQKDGTTSGGVFNYNNALGFAVHANGLNFQAFGVAGGQPPTGSFVNITTNGSTGTAEGNAGGTVPRLSVVVNFATTVKLAGVDSGSCSSHTIKGFAATSPSFDSYGFGTCSGTATLTSTPIWNSTNNDCEASWFAPETGYCWNDSAIDGLPVGSAVAS